MYTEDGGGFTPKNADNKLQDDRCLNPEDHILNFHSREKLEYQTLGYNAETETHSA
jgi:hypothetical protein